MTKIIKDSTYKIFAFYWKRKIINNAMNKQDYLSSLDKMEQGDVTQGQ